MMTLFDEAADIISKRPQLAQEIYRQMRDRRRSAAVGLTDKQREVLDFLRAFAAEHDGQTPSYREIALGVDLVAISGVMRLLVALEERGYITRLERRPRSIRLLEDA